MKKEFFGAVATLVGFTVGAGILSIPYVFSKAGFLTGIISIILIGFFVMILNLMIGETILRTKKSHQLVGYAKKYLGNKGKNIIMTLLLLYWYSAMVAYIIKIGEFLSALFNPMMIISPFLFSIFFAIVASYIIYKGIKLIEKSEFWMIITTITIIMFIGIFSIPSINLNNLSGFEIGKFWIPFGVVLFAFGGAGAIPEMKEELKKNNKLLKNAIITGTTISAILYILFALFVMGVTGINTTDGAIIGLGNVLGYRILLFGVFFGILTMFTSFLAVGLAIKEIFKWDINNHNLQSSIMACAIPFVVAIFIILLKIDNAFYKVIDLAGALIYPFICTSLVIMFWKAKKRGERKPEYSLRYAKILGISIIILFLAGFVNELIKMLI
jgi:amino acid permease